MALGRVGGVVCVDAREKVPQMAQFAEVCEADNTDLSMYSRFVLAPHSA
jgi:hypothetical protein